MKIIFSLLVLFFSIPFVLFGQSNKETGDGSTVYIINDIKLSTSQNSGLLMKSSAGTGSLGILFRKRYLYGKVAFNVVSKNDVLSTTDSSEVKMFANNLLLPELSGQGLSSFIFSIGWKSFSKYDLEDNWDDVKLFDPKRIGLYVYWQANNTVWTKDSISTSISINSPGIYLTYNVLNLQLLNEDKDKVYLSAFGGVQWRFLGGDYGLAGREDIRRHFFGSNKVDYVGSTFGFNLEFGRFFGKIQETYFWGKDNIPGFSGWQAVISIGANIELNIPARPVKPTIIEPESLQQTNKQ